jgi:hypothetical protein
MKALRQTIVDWLDRIAGRPTRRDRESELYWAKRSAEREMLATLGYREWLASGPAIWALREHELEFRRLGSSDAFKAKPAYLDPMFNVADLWWRRPTPESRALH